MTKFSNEKSYKDKKIIKCRTMKNKTYKQPLTLADKSKIISILEKRLKKYVDKLIDEKLNQKKNLQNYFVKI